MYSKKFAITNQNSHNSIYQGAAVNVETNFHLFCLALELFFPQILLLIPTLGSFLVDSVGFCIRTLGVMEFGFFICKVEKDLSNMLLLQECE